MKEKIYVFNQYVDETQPFQVIMAGNKSISYEELTKHTAVLVHKILVSVESLVTKKTKDLPASVKDYLDEHLEQSLKLDELVSVFHYSKNHIINTFREYYGMTPYTYYEKQKMQTARELLTKTSSNISEISKKLGYDNPRYFSKCFKKYFHVTPRQFR